MSSPHNNVQLYHATLQKYVDDIKAKIRLDAAKERTDFCRPSHSFYLTDSYETAKNVMAPEVGGFEDLPTAIMMFSLNLTGLKVKTFSKELSGSALDEWRRVCASPELRLQRLLMVWFAVCQVLQGVLEEGGSSPTARSNRERRLRCHHRVDEHEERYIQVIRSSTRSLIIRIQVVISSLSTVTSGSMRFLPRKRWLL